MSATRAVVGGPPHVDRHDVVAQPHGGRRSRRRRTDAGAGPCPRRARAPAATPGRRPARPRRSRRRARRRASVAIAPDAAAAANGPHGATPTAMFATVSTRTTVPTVTGRREACACGIRHLERGGEPRELVGRVHRLDAGSRRRPTGRPAPWRRARGRGPRPLARVRREAGRSPIADSIAATISSSWASVLSLPMQSRSQPAARARTAASGMPCTPLAPCMSRASVTMTPSNPSSPRSRPCTMRGERVAGLLRVELRAAGCG